MKSRDSVKNKKHDLLKEFVEGQELLIDKMVTTDNKHRDESDSTTRPTYPIKTLLNIDVPTRTSKIMMDFVEVQSSPLCVDPMRNLIYTATDTELRRTSLEKIRKLPHYTEIVKDIDQAAKEEFHTEVDFSKITNGTPAPATTADDDMANRFYLKAD